MFRVISRCINSSSAMKKNIVSLRERSKGNRGTHRTPLEAPMLVYGALDTERDTLEPPEAGEDGKHACAKDDALRAVREAASGEDEVVEEVREHEHRGSTKGRVGRGSKSG